MNKHAVTLSSLAIAGVIWFFAASKPVIQPKHVHESRSEDEELIAIPHGKVLYVVVDKDGVYLGEKKFDLGGAKVAIAALLKEQKIPNLIIYGTDLARYGDVIELYGGFDPSLIRWSTFSFRPLTIGTRKPLTGFLKRDICCGYYDSENDPHEE